MGEGSRRAIAWFGVLLFLFLSSCEAARREGVNSAVQQAQADLTVGDFQGVIDIYKGAYQKYPGDSMLRNNYLQSLEAIKKNADQTFERKDFALAGSTYEILRRNFPQFADLAPSLSFNEKILEQRIQTSWELFVQKQVQLYLAAGEFQKTIEIYQKVYPQYSKDSTVRRSYTRALQAIKKKADQAFAGKDFARAGRIYEILWRNYPHFTDLNLPLSWSRESLYNRVQDCKKFLDKRALEQYRSGNLRNATAIWKSILEFDPEDAEIKKAVDTATIQLRNLEKMK